MMIPLLTSMKDVDIANAHQILTIVASDMQITRLLELSINSPVAEIRGIFRDSAGIVFYLADVNYRGDAIHREMNSKP